MNLHCSCLLHLLTHVHLPRPRRMNTGSKHVVRQPAQGRRLFLLRRRERVVQERRQDFRTGFLRFRGAYERVIYLFPAPRALALHEHEHRVTLTPSFFFPKLMTVTSFVPLAFFLFLLFKSGCVFRRVSRVPEERFFLDSGELRWDLHPHDDERVGHTVHQRKQVQFQPQGRCYR
jgi:hypothetical protein